MSATSSTGTPHRDAACDYRWLILVIVAVAQLMVVLDTTVVNIALPSAQRALGFPDSDRQWVVTAYALAFGSLLLVGGRLGDMFGRKRVFLAGLAGFALFSAVGGAAVSFAMLVIARGLQGAFGAILAPSALGTLVATFRDPRQRGKAFGVFQSVAAGGGTVGLILGGILTEYASWRWTLYVNLVFAAVAAAGALRYMHGDTPADRPRMDWTGAVLSTAGLFAIVYGLAHAQQAGWAAALTVGSLAAGAALLAAFILAERKAGQPLLPPRILADRARAAAYLMVGLTGTALFGVFLFLAYYLQLVKGYSPVTCGLAFLPMVGCILLASNGSSIVLLPRVGPRALIVTGMLLGAAGMFYLTGLTPAAGYPGSVLPALLSLGLGVGMVFSPAIYAATAGVSRRDSGVASALANTVQQAGASIGTAALSTVALTATAGYLAAHHAAPAAQVAATVHGYTAAFTVSGTLFAVSALLAVALLPSRARLNALGNVDVAQAPSPAASHSAPEFSTEGTLR